MTHIVIIGGSGHVGTYLVPHLIQRGYKVTNVSRGTAKPYRPNSAWDQVKQVKADRKEEEKAGTFGNRIKGLKADIIIDMIAFELDSVKHLVEAVKGTIEHYIFCSTVWVFGHLTTIPAEENDRKVPFDEYGKKKLEIEEYLMREARLNGFPGTSFRPGHIVGEGWIPVNPQGNLNPQIYSDIAQGKEITLPNIGLETVNHVHADDCARWVIQAIENRSATIGECFNCVATQALSLRGYTEAMYAYFGKTPKIRYAPLEEWAKTEGLEEGDVNATRSHVTHSPCSSVEKSRIRLGWVPRYTSLEAIQESVEVLIQQGKVKRAEE